MKKYKKPCYYFLRYRSQMVGSKGTHNCVEWWISMVQHTQVATVNGKHHVKKKLQM